MDIDNHIHERDPRGVDVRALMDDLFNAAHCHTADGFDELDSCVTLSGGASGARPGTEAAGGAAPRTRPSSAIRSDLGASCTPEQETLLLQGTARLYRLARDGLSEEMARFEDYALATCLHAPSDLRDTSETEGVGDDEGGGDGGGAAEGQLESLRAAIAAERTALRRARRQQRQYEEALEATAPGADAMVHLARALNQKENVTRGVKALLGEGARLEALLARADKLFEDDRGGADAPDAAPTRAPMVEAPLHELKAMRDFLCSA